MSLIVIYQCPHRTLSRSPALAPSVTSFSTVLAILFLVAMYNALNLSLSCVEAGGYQIHVHVRVLRTPVSSFLHLHISLPLPSPPPHTLPSPHTPPPPPTSANPPRYLLPLTTGKYPTSMVTRAGSRMPSFTPDQAKMITGAIDFVAINYYFPYVVSPGSALATDPGSIYKDMNITTGFAVDSKFYGTWPLSQTGWGIYAAGLRDVLLYTSKQYPQLPIYVTENGLAWKETEEEAVHDTVRQQYLSDHINAVGEAIQGGANVKGYFIWSLQDNLEWNSGFEMQFGITYIKRPSLERVPKGSLHWYAMMNAQFKAMHV